MLVFSAITPHPPILIPTIGKENLKQIKKTAEAMKLLEEELYASQPDVIIIISPHGAILPDAFSINLSPIYRTNLEEFGDFGTKKEFKNNLMLINRFREEAEDKSLPLVLISEENLDHGSSVPLFYLTKHLPNIAIIPIGYSLLDYKSHLDFGDSLKNEIFNSNKRIAVIASGDLSHRLTKEAPAGYSTQGKIFDQKLIELLKKKDIKGILNLDPKLIEEAGECGLRSILILLGIIQRINYDFEVLSYEGPFGVGYLVGNFKIK